MFAATFASLTLSAIAGPTSETRFPVLVGNDLVLKAGLQSTSKTQKKVGSDLSVRWMTENEVNSLSHLNHEAGRCGGYERLSSGEVTEGFAEKTLKALAQAKSQKIIGLENEAELPFRAAIAEVVAQVSANRIGDSISWFSSHPTRYNRHENANVPVYALKARIERALVTSPIMSQGAQIDLIDHQSTPQKSIRLRIPGRTHPEQVIVLGGHLDSINQGGRDRSAPGADGNASGTSCLLEAAYLIAQKGPLNRTVEFYWYAGEEDGLLGSAEIAKSAKQAGQQIVAAMQLDMTLFPGDGSNRIAMIRDYTNDSLSLLMKQLNSHYVKADVEDDTCGYACSDHASWSRQGFPAVFPFEATRMNGNIHTTQDTVTPGRTSFEHAAIFAKLAAAFALEMAEYSSK